jgi:ubiquinol-cytochrome c reductase cytochrome b subunit
MDDPLRDPLRFVEDRTGAAPFLRRALRYLFPDHWSFLLGEVALYAFIVLVATGIYLTLFFEPSLSETVYHGSYAPLEGTRMSEAYRSALDLSFKVKAGLLMRQTHHWAADVFVVAAVLHMLRVFFTAAYRRPRELTYFLGLGMLFTALLEGYLGYSLVDDLLSGMGLAIGYSVALSIPVIGPNLGLLLWGGPFPGAPEFESRIYIAHVFLFPVLIGALLALHLALVAARHHTQFRSGRGETEHRLIGVPAFPGQTPRSLGLMLGVLFPLVVLLVLVLYPSVERRVIGDRARHNIADRPRDAPGRTAFGLGFLTWIAIIFISGSADRATVFFGLSYMGQIWFYRVAVWVLPVLVFLVTRKICRDLQRAELVEELQEAAEEEARLARR